MSELVAIAVVTSLSSARKAFSLYPAVHPEHSGALDSLVAAVATATGAGPCTLNLHLGRLYHESQVLANDAPGMRSMADAFESHRIESMTFNPGFTRTDATTLLEVLALKPSADLDVGLALEDRGVFGVVVQRLVEPDAAEAEEREEQRGRDRAMYLRLVTALRRINTQLGPAGSPSLGDTAVVVENLMARFMEDSAAVLGLATMRDASEADLFHCVNTLIYALTIGVGLEIPEEGLTALGVCALLHDIGKVAFNRDDPGQEERVRLQHPRVGAEILARMPEVDQAAMLVAFEHHFRPDGTGWPEMEPNYIAHPYSRIVSIADRYDRLTTSAPEAGGLTPDRAIVQLLREATADLDRTFARVFVREMGAFPVGCMVRLSDQSVGVVSAPGEDPLQPHVRLVYGPDGLTLATKTGTDLAGSELSIIEVVHPDDLRETVSDHL
ncbi:MAG: HD domain-containing protein [Actinobacteria bacterium]|nr:HD domain-containing protein [Actinomycetota bacterium]